MIEINKILLNNFNVNINFKKRYNQIKADPLIIYQNFNSIEGSRIFIFLLKTLQMKLNRIKFYIKIEEIKNNYIK
jgi:hypothetical protein